MSSARQERDASAICTTGNEIINIGIGRAGIYMLNEFYSTIMPEHKIDKAGKFIGNWNQQTDKFLMLKNNTFFREDSKIKDKYIPRAIFLDCDKSR